MYITQFNNQSFSSLQPTNNKFKSYSFNLAQEFQYGSFKKKFQHEKELFDNFAHKEGMVTKNELSEIEKYNPRIIKQADLHSYLIRKKCDMVISPNYAAKSAIAIKDSLDKEYGENNYRVISIGTSPACITQLLPELGCETVFLPISNAMKYASQFSHLSKEENPKVAQLSRFLAQKGVNRDKTNVLIDYTSSFKTIDFTESILEDLLGIDCKYNSIIPLQRILLQAGYYEHPELLEPFGAIINIFDYDMREEKVAILSCVPHFNICPDDIKTSKLTWELKPDKVQFREFNQYSKYSARAFGLSALNQIKKIKKSEG